MDWLGFASRELIPIIGLGITLAFLPGDWVISRYNKRWLFIAFVLGLIDTLLFGLDIWASALDGHALERIISVEAGNILRSVIIISMIYLTVGKPKTLLGKALRFVPLGVNSTIACAALFSGAAFRYDGADALRSGPLSYTVHFVLVYYLLLLLALNIARVKERNKANRLGASAEDMCSEQQERCRDHLLALMEKILNIDYEAVGEIDKESGLMTIIRGLPDYDEFLPEKDAFPYLKKLPAVLERLVAADYVEDAMRAMNINRIISELERRPTYTVTMPARCEDKGYNGVYQWRFCYVDDARRSIMLLRGGMITFARAKRRTCLADTGDADILKASHRKILVADDEPLIRTVLRLAFENDYEVIEAANGEEAIAGIDEFHDELALIFLDNIMPKKTGLDVLVHLKRRGLIGIVPVVMVTADDSSEKRINFYDYQIADFITKPFDREVIQKRAYRIIAHYEHTTSAAMQLKERTDEIALMQQKADRTNEFLINALSSVVEFRNLESGQHIERVRKLSEIMMRAWAKVDPDSRFTEEDISLISKAAALHDIGKIAIPDEVLLKTGKLTPEEYAIMQKHPTLGCEILERFKQDDSSFYRYCYDICRYHQERFDGSGYPDKLSGDLIPVWAQVVSIVDVFDALVNKRAYKNSYPVDTAIEMIKRGECGKFSPKLLACFDMVKDEIKAASEKLVEDDLRDCEERKAAI